MSPDVITGNNFVTKGIPGISSETVERIRNYTEFRATKFIAWHPTQREMLIRTRIDTSDQIYQVASPGGPRHQLTFYADAVNTASFPRQSADFYVFSKDTDGGEFYQNYCQNFHSGETRLLTDGKSRNTPGVWSRYSDQLAYESTRRNGRDTDIYILAPSLLSSNTTAAPTNDSVNLSPPCLDRLLAPLEGSGWSVEDWSPNDQFLLVRQSVSYHESYLWQIDISNGAKIPLTPSTSASQAVSYRNARWSRDGKSFYCITDKDSEFHRLARFNLEKQQLEFLPVISAWDVTEFDLSADGKQIAFVVNEEGFHKLRLLDTDTYQERSPPSLPTGVITNIKFRPDGEEIAFTFSNARTPGDVYTMDIRTRIVNRWTYNETSEPDPQAFVEPELVHWHSFDDRRLSGFLYLPSSCPHFSAKSPVIIFIHGGPEGQALPGFLEAYNYFLQELGIAIIFPNVRGSSGYGKTFLKLDNGLLREDAYKDIGTLLDWISIQPNLDAERVMILGYSYGGHMTLATAALYADRIQCACSLMGMSNLVTFLENTQEYRRNLRRTEYGDERDPEIRTFLQSIAPLHQVEKITKPLFIVQGKNDPRVPYTEAEQMVSALEKQGTQVWYLLANDEGHHFVKKSNANYLFYTMTQFAQQYLLREPIE